MKCRHCGYESETQFAFCPCCGNAVTDANGELCVERENVSENIAAKRILNVLRDNMFLVLCILFTVGTGVGLLDENFSVINILATVFLWLTYAGAQRGIADAKQLRNLSGTVYASYIITYIVCGIAILLALLCALVFNVFGEAITEELIIEGDPDVIAFLASISVAMLGLILAVIFTVVAVAMLLVNIFGTRSIHKLIQSTYRSIECGRLELVKCKAAHNWLMVLGVLQAISAVLSFVSQDFYIGISMGCIAAAEIIGATLINRNFFDCE